MTDHINRRFHPQTLVSPEQVLFSAGVTSVNEIVAWNLADAGDGILLNMPIYGPFQIDFTAKAECALFR
jgi:1-aminocyclopropane-1-carboxylate synthase